ncbi:FemAB family protein [Microcoleus sp. N3A4]|uniref:FemAB family protein n=1 Tax=Microcoleus sp. N3A4 TaxID=3055379 RepID=UPI002FD0D900
MNVQIIDIQNTLWLKTLQKLRHDVYDLPEYAALESSRTNTTPEAVVIVDGDKIFFVPYLLRRCDDILPPESTSEAIFDAVSPYGYPGILLSEAAANTPGFPDFAMNQLTGALKSKSVCSAFFRLHPILNCKFNEIFEPGIFTVSGETVSVNLKLSEAELWAHTRRGHQSTINKCKRLGFTAKMVPVEQYMNELKTIYEETMNRVESSKSYYYKPDYFAQLFNFGEAIHLCIVEWEEQVAAACLFFECCGIVQAHLGGTKTQFLHGSPFNLLLDYVRYWAKERGNEFLHLGGGVGSSKDSLYTFKSGFSRQKHNFLTGRLIADQEKYNYLVGVRAKFLNIQPEELLKSNFFPAYRAPN